MRSERAEPAADPDGTGGARGKPREPRLADRVAGPAAGLVVALWSWALSSAMAGPIVFHDELAPVGWARHLRHGTPMPPIGVPFYPGYGSLLALVSPEVLDPASVHAAARALNAVLSGLTAWAAVGLARLLVGTTAGAGASLAVALAASLHAPVILYGHLAIPDNLLFAGVTIALVIVARSLERPSAARMAVAGAVVGGLPLIHVRATAVVIGFVVGVAGWAGVRARRGLALGRARGVALTLGLALGLTAAWLGARWVAAASPAALAGMARAHSLGRISSRSLGLFAGRLPCVLAGQALYLGLATFGVAWLAMGATWRRARAAVAGEGAPGADAELTAAAIAVMVVTSALATWSMSSVFFNTGMRRLDQALNGRYVESIVVPLLVFGFAAVVRTEPGGRPRAAKPALVAGLVTAACGVVAAQVGRFVPLDHGFNPATVLALHPWLGAAVTPDVWLLSLLGGAAAMVGVGLALARPRLALVAWIAWSLVTAVGTSRDYLVAGSRERAGERVVADALAFLDRDRAVPECVGLDYPSWSLWHAHWYSFLRPAQRFVPFDSRRSEMPCSELVVSANRELGRAYPGARVIARERGDADRLWVLSGELSERLTARGLTEPERWGELPAAAARSELAWIGAPRRDVVAGRGNLLRVAVVHRGEASPWLARAELGRAEGAIRLGVRWYRDGAGGRPVGESRVDLPHALLPGAALSLDVPVPPPEIALAPGTYHVVVGMLQEGVRWFRDRGDAVLQADVTLEPR